MEKALELDASLPEAHAYLGSVLGFYNYDWAGAEREMKRAMELGPAVAEVHFCYAMHFLQPVGRLREAAAEFKRAAELDPLSHLAVVGLAENAYRRNAPDKAITLSKQALELDSMYFFSHWMLGLAHFLEGRISEAVDSIERAAAFSERNPWVLSTLCNLYSRAGQARGGGSCNGGTGAAGRAELCGSRSFWDHVLRPGTSGTGVGLV